MAVMERRRGLFGRRTARDDRIARDEEIAREERIERGASLARGPALVLGTILLVAGLYLMYKAHTFPRFKNFPNGTATPDGKFFFGIFAANGWTGLLTAAAGGLLLFGAAHHLLAKTMSLIVGIALGAAAIIGAVSGNVLGLAAANVWTEVLWGASAVILLLNSLMPRRKRVVTVPAAASAGGPRATAVDDAPEAATSRQRARFTQADETGLAEHRAGDRTADGAAVDEPVSPRRD